MGSSEHAGQADGSSGQTVSYEDRIRFNIAMIGLLLFILCIPFGLWFQWYRAAQQVKVYEQQGIHMTQWQVFIGVHPASSLRSKP